MCEIGVVDIDAMPFNGRIGESESGVGSRVGRVDDSGELDGSTDADGCPGGGAAIDRRLNVGNGIDDGGAGRWFPRNGR